MVSGEELYGRSGWFGQLRTVCLLEEGAKERLACAMPRALCEWFSPGEEHVTGN
jgi:hypothetical protein